MDLTVLVATFGDEKWLELAWKRAIPSAAAQAKVLHRHGSDLAEARNACLAEVETEWVCYLDADDELEPGYVEAMAAGSADVRGPMARYVQPGGIAPRLWQPRVHRHRHDCTRDCIPKGNWLLIGSAVRAELLREVGGWEPWPMYEDWAIFLRCWKAGASFELIRDAVYRAHVRPDSRNRKPSVAEREQIHYEIADAILGDPVP